MHDKDHRKRPQATPRGHNSRLAALMLLMHDKDHLKRLQATARGHNSRLMLLMLLMHDKDHLKRPQRLKVTTAGWLR